MASRACKASFAEAPEQRNAAPAVYLSGLRCKLRSWSLPPATFHTAIGQFVEAGKLPRAGAKWIGRWHGMSGRGFAVAEATEDADAGAVLRSLQR